jgi:hypothetical protein
MSAGGSLLKEHVVNTDGISLHVTEQGKNLESLRRTTVEERQSGGESSFFLIKRRENMHRPKGPSAGPKVMKTAVYWILFLGQTTGDGTILSHLIPLFRQLVTSGVVEKASPKILILAVLGVILIQVCYWLAQYRFSTLRLHYVPLLGHLVLFLSRLNFIFAAAVFSAVYLVRFKELDISFLGFVLLSTVLFSIFCYTLELERLGKAFLERSESFRSQDH